MAKGTKAKKGAAKAAPGRKRTKGPSDKMRALAAGVLANRVAYLKLSDVIGEGNSSAEAAVNKFSKKSYKTGETIPTDSGLALLKSGSVAISRTTKQGRKIEVKRVEPGTLFGELSMIGQTMLDSRAEAAEQSEVASISESDLTKLASSSSDVALNLIRHLGPRLVDSEKRREQAAFQPVTSRLASLLIRLSGGNGVVTGYTHQDFADMLGVYRETVTNALSELRNDRMIKLERKKVTLSNLPGLQKLEKL